MMKRNLLATTAAAAVLVSGGMWAQAQAPGQKQDDRAQMHDQKGAGAAKQNRAEEAQAGKQDSNAAKDQQTQDVRQKGNTAQDEANAKTDNASKSAEQAQPKRPQTASDDKKTEPRTNERDRRNTASEMNNGKARDNTKNKSHASKETKDHNQAAADRKDQPKAAQQQEADDQKANRSKRQADQSTSHPNTNAADSKAGNADNQKEEKNAAQKNAPTTNQQAGTSSTNTQHGDRVSAKLSESDRGKVFSTLKTNKQASNQRVDIQVNVGTRLPPRVHPRPLPRTVVEVMPQYRGYEFVMVRDEIAIVRPGTREVVDVIREPGSSSTFASTTTHRGGTTIHLTDQQRTTLREEAERFKTSQVSGAGSQCLSLQPVPESLAKDNPDLKQYQMLAIGDDVVLVDPNQKKIVDVIQ